MSRLSALGSQAFSCDRFVYDGLSLNIILWLWPFPVVPSF